MIKMNLPKNTKIVGNYNFLTCFFHVASDPRLGLLIKDSPFGDFVLIMSVKEIFVLIRQLVKILFLDLWFYKRNENNRR